MSMARTQTLVQLTEDLLSVLDARAAQERRSRSELVRDALTAYLAEGIEAEIDRQIVEGYERIPPEADPWDDWAARRLIEVDGW